MAKEKEVKEEAQVSEPVDEKPDEDSVAAQLKQLGAALMATAEDQVASKETLSKIEKLLGSLQIKDYPQLAESPVVQTLLNMLGVDALRPGEVVNRGTLAERDREWTWRDLQKLVLSGEMPLMTFVPAETITVTWNGLMLQLPANREIQVPRCFYDIYKEHVFAMEQAAKNEAYMMGQSDIPPHPNWQTPEGAVVRAMSEEARKYGRRGGAIGVGPIQDFETALPPEGGQNG